MCASKAFTTQVETPYDTNSLIIRAVLAQTQGREAIPQKMDGSQTYDRISGCCRFFVNIQPSFDVRPELYDVIEFKTSRFR